MIGKIYITSHGPCCNGWPGTETSPACQHSGEHFCDLAEGHGGPCRCECGASAFPPASRPEAD